MVIYQIVIFKGSTDLLNVTLKLEFAGVLTNMVLNLLIHVQEGDRFVVI